MATEKQIKYWDKFLFLFFVGVLIVSGIMLNYNLSNENILNSIGSGICFLGSISMLNRTFTREQLNKMEYKK